VVLAVLTAGIDHSGSDLVDETLVDCAPEPRSVQPAQIHAGDDSSASRFDELVHQLGRRLTPDWLDVLEPGARHPFFVPCANVRCFDCGLLSR